MTETNSFLERELSRSIHTW